MRTDSITALSTALGADLLRSRLLGAPLPKLGGRYVVETVVGRGATGVVVSALDDRLGRPVALKLRVTGGDATMLEEARALALLDHPNVVRVHDVDIAAATFDGVPFRIWLVSMQLVVGTSLRNWLGERPRSVDAVVRAFAEAGRGLAAAHRQRIVHRDFKPDNVIVRADDGVAMVLDFGFAVPVLSSLGDGPDARNSIAGTDPYMAPEARAGNASRRSDQYAFGVSLVEAFTGSPTPARRRPRSVPREVWSVAERATAERADRRFADMDALLAALSQVRPAPSGSWRRAAVVGTPLLAAGAFAVWWWSVTAAPPDKQLRPDTVRPEAGVTMPASGCPSELGSHRFVAVPTYGGPTDDLTRGIFQLDVRAGARTSDVRLTNHAFPVAPRDVISDERASDCSRRISLVHLGRRYEFVLRVAPAGVSGKFTAFAVAGREPYGGNLRRSP